MAKRVISVVLTLGVTVLLVMYAFRGVDMAELGRVLWRGAYWVLAPYWLLLFLFYWWNAQRWVHILKPMGSFTARQVFPASIIGFAGNNVLPARLGELVRVLVFSRQFKLSRSGVLMTLVLERAWDVFAILVFYLAAFALIHPFPEQIRVGSQVVALVFGLVCLVLVWFMAAPHFFERRWRSWSFFLPHSLRERGSRTIHQVAEGLSALKAPGLVFWMANLSLLRWAVSGGMVWLALLAYGVHVSFAVCLVVLAVSALAVSLPSVPGFFGVIQAAFVFALTPFGLPAEPVLAASFLFLLAQWVPITLLGLYYFLHAHLNLRQISQDLEREG